MLTFLRLARPTSYGRACRWSLYADCGVVTWSSDPPNFAQGCKAAAVIIAEMADLCACDPMAPEVMILT